MTRFAFSEHTYPDEPEKWLQAPVGKHLDIMRCALEPHDGVRQIDVCCGLGFGKTVLGIQIAVMKLDLYKSTKILFLEPDWDKVEGIFLETWDEHVPPQLYNHEVGKQKITWLPTGAILRYKPRVITGSKALSQDRRRGPEFTDVIDDETAIGFDLETYQNTLARIRARGECKTYTTLTTPKVGAYGRFLNRGGNTIFRGRTRDNHYLLKRQPDYETNLRAAMSTEQARRELDGELIALEGRIWKDADQHTAWPRGNRHDQFAKFDPSRAWWLFCDLGGATGAYVVVQKTDARYNGRELFRGSVWVAVADYCPRNEADASAAFQKLKLNFGRPVAVTAGKDINTRDRTDGRTVAFFVEQVWPGVDIYPCHEDYASRQIQYNRMLYLFKAATGERRFCVAKDFVSLAPDSYRGVREMIEQDAYPAEDKIRASDFLPKNREITVQHVRDALLMGAETIMAPPGWSQGNAPAG